MKGIKYYFVILSLCFGLSLTAQNKVSFLIDDGFWVGVNRSMHLLAKMHPTLSITYIGFKSQEVAVNVSSRNLSIPTITKVIWIFLKIPI